MQLYTKLLRNTKKKPGSVTGTMCHMLAGPPRAVTAVLCFLFFFTSFFIICSVALKMFTQPPTLAKLAPDGKRSHLSHRARTGKSSPIFITKLQECFPDWMETDAVRRLSILEKCLGAAGSLSDA